MVIFAFWDAFSFSLLIVDPFDYIESLKLKKKKRKHTILRLKTIFVCSNLILL